MEQVNPIADKESSALPPVEQVPKWDPEKAAMRKVRVIKVPYDQDPMKEQTTFEYAGFVYICYAKKTRGRSMIRCLGLSDVEGPREDEPPPVKGPTPFEAGEILDNAEDAFKAAMGDAIAEAIDDEIMKEVTGDG